jgi:hypothetical protein
MTLIVCALVILAVSFLLYVIGGLMFNVRILIAGAVGAVAAVVVFLVWLFLNPGGPK